MRLWLDVYNSSGTQIGAGPITTATGFSATTRLNRAGQWQCSIPATDMRAADLLQPKRTVLAWIADGDQRYFVGGGVIDTLVVRVDATGQPLLDVSGQDLLEELNRVSMGETVITNLVTTGLSNFEAWILYFLPLTWDTGNVPDDQAAFVQAIAYDTLLGMLTTVCDRFSMWFRRIEKGGNPRYLDVLTSLPSTVTLRAFGNGQPAYDDLNSCMIVDIAVEQQAADVYTRIIPFGSGNAQARLTLRSATQWPDGSALSGDYVVDGQTLKYAPRAVAGINSAEARIYNHTAETIYGNIARAISFKDIVPISNSTADTQTAANVLLQAACRFLLKHSQPITTYNLTITGLRRAVEVGELVHVTARKFVDGERPINIDANLRVLEVRTEVDVTGIVTTGLIVSTADVWPTTDMSAVVETIRQNQIMEALPQMSASVDTISYREPIDDNYSADLRFWLGNETTTVNQVLVRFRVDPFRSTSKAIGGSASGSVDIPNHTHDVTIGAHAHDVTIGAHTHDVTIGNHTHTTPNHTHSFRISGGSTPIYNVGFGAAGTAGGLVHNASGSDFNYPTNSGEGGATSASGGGTTVTSASGGGTTVTSASGGGTTVTSASGGGSTGLTVDISTALTIEYGIYEDSGANTYAAADLEWLVNGSAASKTPVDAGGGWYTLNITPDVVAADGLRPVQAANVVTVRVAAASKANKRCQITAQIERRTVIQAIAYS